MSSLGLTMFTALCDVGNALAVLRDREEPGSDQWTALTCLLLMLDEGIDTLVRSNGLGGKDDDG